MSEVGTEQERVDLVTRHFRAGHRVIAMRTYDEPETMERVRAAAYAVEMPVLSWSASTGMRDATIDEPGNPDTHRPDLGLAAMSLKLAQDHTARVCVLLDIAPHLSDATVLRGWRELAHRVEDRRGHLVMVDYTSELPALVDNYAVKLEVPFPDDEEIKRVVRRCMRQQMSAGDLDVQLRRSEVDTLIESLRGLTRRQIERVMIDLVAEDRALNAEDLPQVAHLKRELVADAGVLEHVESLANIDDIAGLGNLKKWLAQRRGAFDSKAKSFGLKPPRGVLMLGVQGTGKSLTAKAVAAAWSRPLLRLDPGRLYNKFIGESERTLRDALGQAEAMAPIVLWIDEIEKGFAAVGGSGSMDGGLSKRMFGTLLTWMNDHRSPVFIIATANDIETLPPELLRKGRFDEIFFVDLPSEAVRRDVFRIHLRLRDRDPDAFELDELARASDGFSPAEIAQAIEGALHSAYHAEREVRTKDIAHQLSVSPPLSVTAAEKVRSLQAWARGRCVPAD